MRIMGFDIGEKRIGVAVARAGEGIATPLCVVDGSDSTRASREIASLIDEWGVEALVVGLPLTLAGEEGPQARRVRTLAGRLLDGVGLPVNYTDERYTSTGAGRVLAEAGLSERQARGRLDAIAASMILQTYLDGVSADSSQGSV